MNEEQQPKLRYRVQWIGLDIVSAARVTPECFSLMELGDQSTQGMLRSAEQLRFETDHGFIDSNMLTHVSKDPRNRDILGFNLMQMRLEWIAGMNWLEQQDKVFNAFIEQIRQHSFDEILKEYEKFVQQVDQNCAIPMDAFFYQYGFSEQQLYEIDIQVQVQIVINEIQRAITKNVENTIVLLSARLNSALVLLYKSFGKQIDNTDDENRSMRLQIAQKAIARLIYVQGDDFRNLLQLREGICECFIIHSNKARQLNEYLRQRQPQPRDMSNRELTQALQEPVTRKFFLNLETKRFEDRDKQIRDEHAEFNRQYNLGHNNFKYISVEEFHQQLYDETMWYSRTELYTNNILGEELHTPIQVFPDYEPTSDDCMQTMPNEI